MPTLPLYTPIDTAGASHRVVAPGGYERWRFDGESESGDFRFVAILGAGWPFSGEYRRQYDRYLRRPTRHRPPVPTEYPTAHFAVYEGSRPIGQWTMRYSARDFAESNDPVWVRIGPNELLCDADGTFAITLCGSATSNASDEVSARLCFRPRWPRAVGDAIPASPVSISKHFRQVTDPLCDVSGTIVVPGAEHRSADARRRIEFIGRGYHDHEFGTAPLATIAQRRFRGRVLFADRVYAFNALRSHPSALLADVDLLSFGPHGSPEIASLSASLDWTSHERHLRPYPSELVFGTRLRLSEARVIDSTPAYVRLLYQANADDPTEPGSAFCEVENLGRS